MLHSSREGTGAVLVCEEAGHPSISERSVSLSNNSKPPVFEPKYKETSTRYDDAGFGSVSHEASELIRDPNDRCYGYAALKQNQV
jgi:hypothetical protein